MSLPEGVSIITETNRDNFDTYVIPSGCTFCFEFTAEDGQTTEIGMIHTKHPAQDLSLRCWFSTKPLGAVEFVNSDNHDVFPILRQFRTILIGTPSTNTLYKMREGTNYLMVQNMQNSENFFELQFTFKA